jgi:hypothetical protein
MTKNPFQAAYDFWFGIPAPIREPIRSAAVSTAWGLQIGACTLVGAGIVEGYASSPQALAGYCVTHWWGTFVGLIGPALYRARQGRLAATSVVVTSAATSTPNPAPPDPPKPS